MSKKTVKIISLYLGLCIVTVIMVFPFYWMINLSLQKFPRALSFFPKEVTLANYAKILFNSPFPTWFKNSLLIASMTTAIAVLLSVFSGYALSRFTFIGKSLFAIGLISTQAIPRVILLIPLYIVFTTFGLINTYFGLTVSYLTICLPFCTWMLWGFFSEIPSELEEAALIDGCTRVKALLKVVVPLAAPGIVAVAIFSFVLAWEEYLYTLTFMSDVNMLTITVGASRYVGHERIIWGPATALAFLSTVPVVLFFMYIQKYMVEGLTLGAIKR